MSNPFRHLAVHPTVCCFLDEHRVSLVNFLDNGPRRWKTSARPDALELYPGGLGVVEIAYQQEKCEVAAAVELLKGLYEEWMSNPFRHLAVHPTVCCFLDEHRVSLVNFLDNGPV
ncbi:hypothetical protein CSKR_110318 [Clonorchis sinensis]|uniref:Uncharacterized protein n=1 Tax=Clonorchis sinensis TaxID=79923 RepID=A0A419QDX3_CLOSI|nr:hypothetical protein CSKR_110318 [Clonorchis sinensis]